MLSRVHLDKEARPCGTLEALKLGLKDTWRWTAGTLGKFNGNARGIVVY